MTTDITEAIDTGSINNNADLRMINNSYLRNIMYEGCSFVDYFGRECILYLEH